MQAYCEWQSFEMDHMQFLFFGYRVHGTETEEYLEMEDDNIKKRREGSIKIRRESSFKKRRESSERN